MDGKRKPDSNEQLSASQFTILNSGNKTSQIEEESLMVLARIEELCKQADKKPVSEGQNQTSGTDSDSYIEDLVAGLDKFRP